MALSALLLLLPLLLNVQNIPDESVQSDMKAVYSAISSPEQWKDSPNSLASLESQLTEPQRALAKMHWELETIQKEKPESPPQFDLGLFSEALEVMVEMDEVAKEVKLRKDKLIEWAGGEEAKKLKEKTEEKTVPDVWVSENGQIDVKNGAGGDERMEVRRTKDEKGREQVVITLVKRGGTEGPVEGKVEKPQENAKTEEVVQKKKEDKNSLQEQEEAKKSEHDKAGGVPKTNLANSPKSDLPMHTILSFTAPSVEEEGNANVEEAQKKEDKNSQQEREEKKTEQDDARGVPKMDSTDSPKSVVPMHTILSSSASPMEEQGKARDALTEEANGRKKAQNNEEMLLVATENNGIIRNTNNGGLFDFVRKFISNVFGRKKRDTENMTGERRKIRSLENLSTVVKSDSEPKSEDKQQQQEEKKKAEIKQYLEKGVANTGGTKKAEKLAYAWYSELLYWTTKWIEALENRVAGVKPELAQQFLFSKTGSAAYQELKEEVDKCEAKLAKLKEWIGDSFK
ncbi:hypothetical protein niasHT_027910 [Heterodera trifolii]|uniref:Uncharacterized protein n=1 Tax=Heterodera trifolii TaxID=157864 RepID=A0ABD2JDX0_9BILA